jgi:hypothetical protein
MDLGDYIHLHPFGLPVPSNSLSSLNEVFYLRDTDLITNYQASVEWLLVNLLTSGLDSSTNLFSNSIASHTDMRARL